MPRTVLGSLFSSLLLCFAAPSGSAAGVLEIVGQAPLPGEAIENQVLLFFNEPLEPLPGAAGPPLLVEPRNAVQSQRIRGNAIDLQLGALQEAQVLVIRLNPALRGQSGAVPDPETSERVAANFQFLPEIVNYLGRVDGRLDFVVRFPIPADGDSLAKGFRAERQDGTALDTSVVPHEGAYPSVQQWRLSVHTDRLTPLRLHFDAGIQAARVPIAMHEALVLSFPHEEPLRLLSFDWLPDRGGAARFQVEFSHPVAPQRLQNFAVLRDIAADSTMGIRVMPGPPASTLTVSPERRLPRNRGYEFVVQPGLVAPGLQYLASEARLRNVPEARALGVGHAYWQDNGIDGIALSLRLTEPVNLDSLGKRLRFEPPVEDIAVRTEYFRSYRVDGAFRSETLYTLIIEPGIENPDGRVVNPEELTHPLDEAPSARGVKFAHEDKLYFPRRTGDVLAIETRNLEAAQVEVHEIFPNNLPLAVEAVNHPWRLHHGIDTWGRALGARDLRIPPAPDERLEYGVDLTELLPSERRGVFAVTASRPDGYRFEDAKLIVWTDLGLLAHWLDDALLVFVHDLYSLEPKALARVTVYSNKHQELGAGNTGADGIARIENFDASLGTPAMIVAETGDDVSFLALARRGSDVTPFTHRMPEYARDAYDALIYADRELYRPGETVNLRWIVRQAYGDAAGALPLRLEITSPAGSRYREEAVMLSELGTGGLTLETDRADLTGAYAVRLTVPGGRQAVGEWEFKLEDFVPNRIATEVHLDNEIWLEGAPQSFRVAAEFLAGGPAAGQNASAALIFRQGDFTPPGWEDLHFGNDVEFEPEVIELGEAVTDEEGAAHFVFDQELDLSLTFPARASVRGDVMELGGRGVANIAHAVYLADETLVGVSMNMEEGGGQLEIHAAAVRYDGTPAAADSLTVTLERENWYYNVRRLTNYNEPVFNRVFETVSAHEVPLENGRGVLRIDAPGFGHYRVKAEAAETPLYAATKFYSHWGGIQRVDRVRPSLITVTLAEEEHEIGADVSARIESPFDGWALAVVQGEALHRMIPVKIQDGVGEVRFTASREMHPNVWLAVTAVHEVKDRGAQMYPYASFNMINVPVSDPERRIHVALPGLPEEARPSQEIEIEVETRRADGDPAPAEVTLALVDEGIHAITRYESPDPAAYFERTRRPDYRRAHYYDRVAYNFERPPIGGDTMADRLGMLAPPVDENWIAPLALWSGVFQTDAEGRAAVRFTLPEFNGRVRLVAVAADASAAGAVENGMYVRRPYILRTSMPRFALPGDRFHAAAVLSNTTAEPVSAEIVWSVSGALAEGAGAKRFELAPGARELLRPRFSAGADAGQGRIEWRVEVRGADGEVRDSFVEQAPLPVRPPVAYATHHELVVLDPGEERTLRNARLHEDARLETRLHVSANPLWRLQEGMRFVARYPYGCLEQTVSSALPLYLLRNAERLTESALPEESEGKAPHFLRAAIRRLMALQVEDGGLAMWPGGGLAYPYGSVYACHFLTLVHRDKELEVPEQSFRALQEYVRNIAGDWSRAGQDSGFLRAYAHFVLALDGDTDALRQLHRFESAALPPHAHYLIAAAIALNTQDPGRAMRHIEQAPAVAFDTREFGGTLNSRVRNTAIELLAYLEIDPDAMEARERAEFLIDYFAQRDRHTTQDAAFAISALGRYLERTLENLDRAGAEVRAPGAAAPERISGGDAREYVHEGPEGVFTVRNTGAAPIYLNLVTAGIPLQPPVTAEENGIAISRRIMTSSGSPVGEDALEHGATYVVRWDIRPERALEHVVIAELLPAGFEIENPRLEPELLVGAKLEDAVTPSHVEIRDDRLAVVFDALKADNNRYYFLVRAVTPGVFQRPGLQAEAMYDPRAHASYPPSAVTIE